MLDIDRGRRNAFEIGRQGPKEEWSLPHEALMDPGVTSQLTKLAEVPASGIYEIVDPTIRHCKSKSFDYTIAIWVLKRLHKITLGPFCIPILTNGSSL